MQDKHGGVMMSSKPSMTGGKSRYNDRKLVDGAHGEAEDLWEFSQSRMHSATGDKKSLAHYVTLGQTKGMESLPYNTFRNGSVPHTYQTLSLDQNAEETSAPINQTLSPLEFAALAQVMHLLPTDYLHDRQNRTFSTGRDDLMRYGKAHKYKTSYSKASSTKVPYRRTDRTSTTLTTTTKAQASKVANGTAASNVPDPSTSAHLKQASATAMAALAKHAANLVQKAIKHALGGMTLTLKDPDVIGLITAGVTVAMLTDYIQTSRIIQAIPGAGTAIPWLLAQFQIFIQTTSGDKKYWKDQNI